MDDFGVGLFSGFENLGDRLLKFGKLREQGVEFLLAEVELDGFVAGESEIEDLHVFGLAEIVEDVDAFGSMDQVTAFGVVEIVEEFENVVCLFGDGLEFRHALGVQFGEAHCFLVEVVVRGEGGGFRDDGFRRARGGEF